MCIRARERINVVTCVCDCVYIRICMFISRGSGADHELDCAQGVFIRARPRISGLRGSKGAQVVGANECGQVVCGFDSRGLRERVFVNFRFTRGHLRCVLLSVGIS